MTTELRLGKRPAADDPRDLRYAAFAPTAIELPTVPAQFGHGRMFHDWGMLGNGPDPTVAAGFGGAGDCLFAGAGHETELWGHLGGHPVEVTGRESIADYSAVTGYVIGDDSTDRGTDVRDALKYRQKVGILDASGGRHRIGAYVALDPRDWDQLMEAVYIFGAVGIGFRFPRSAWEQFDHREVWDVVDGSPDEGGHYVPVLGRTSRNVAGVVTWGRRQGMTRDFYATYNDEAWAMISAEELRSGGKNERGFDLAALTAALEQLGVAV